MIETVKCTLAIAWMFGVLVGGIDLLLECPIGALAAAAIVSAFFGVMAAAVPLAEWLAARRAGRPAEDAKQ